MQILYETSTYKFTITGMKMEKFDVITNKLNVVRICISGNYT